MSLLSSSFPSPPADRSVVDGRAVDGAAAARERILLRACVLELAGPDRRVMELQLFHGWSVEDIATYVGEPPAEVARRLAGVHERVRHRSGDIALTAVQP